MWDSCAEVRSAGDANNFLLYIYGDLQLRGSCEVREPRVLEKHDCNARSTHSDSSLSLVCNCIKPTSLAI